jgi:hypothetical protein
MKVKLINYYFILYIIFLFSISFSCTKKIKANNLNYEKEFKLNFAFIYFNKFMLNDSVWHDAIPCYPPLQINTKMRKDLDSLITLSNRKLWKRSDEGREFIGSRDGLILDNNCIIDEFLQVYESQELKELAKLYAKMKIGKL